MQSFFLALPFFLLSGLSLLVTSCGYHVGPSAPAAHAEIQTIAIPTAENNTLEPRLAALFTSETVAALTQDGTYNLGHIETADAVLELSIDTIDRRQLRSVPFEFYRTRELGLIMRCSYELRKNDTEGSIIASGRVIGDSSVFPRNNYQTAERDALQDASRRAANELITEIANGW